MASTYINLPGDGVTSLNSLTGSLTLVAGTGISITPAGSNITIAATGGTGTVTSVAMTVPGVIFTSPISGTPITTSGTLALALNTQTANAAFIGPANGAAATPTFRALVPADIPGYVTINTQTTSYTAVLADAGCIVELNNAGAVNFTVPLNATVAYPIGTQITVSQIGAGAVTVVATGGVTIRTPATLVLAEQYATAVLYKRGTDEWVISGYLQP